MQYCGCDIQIHSVIIVSDESDAPVISDEHATAWEVLYVPSVHTREDPNQAPTEVAPSTHDIQEGEAPSIPTPPLLSRLILGKDQRFGDSIAIASSIERLCQAKDLTQHVIA